MSRHCTLIPLLFCLIASLGSIASAQFNTVLNIPPDPNIADRTIIGSHTQINLSDGGVIEERVQVGSRQGLNANIEINIAGGIVEERFTAYNNSTVNISGGNVGSNTHFGGIKQGNFTGGTIGDSTDFHAITSTGGFSIHGSEFRLNGELVAGLETIGDTVVANVPSGLTTPYLLTGVLTDGTPFAFSREDSDEFITQPNLVAAAIPTIGPALLTASAGNLPLGIRSGQTLLVDSGGVVPANFNAHYGSAIEVQAGGTVGENLELLGGTLLIEGGTIGDFLDVWEGSMVDMTGGEVGSNARIDSGSTFNVSGGSIAYSLAVTSGGQFNMSGTAVVNTPRIIGGATATITGGVVASSLNASSGSVVTLSGGAIGGRADFTAGSDVTFQGAEFQLNGTPIAGLVSPGDTTTVTVPEGSLFSGTLADGTPFAFRSGVYRESDLEDATLTLEATSLPQIGPALITASTDPVPLGIRSGQTLVADAGSSVPLGFSRRARFDCRNPTGGRLGEHFKAIGSIVNMSGGEIEGSLKLYNGTIFNMANGAVKNSIDVAHGSTINMSGGTLGEPEGYQGVWLYDSGTLNLSGGTVKSNLVAEDASNLNIFGTEFYLDSVLIEDLSLGLPELIDERGSLLTGTLLDGTPFDFWLEPNESSGNFDQISANATVNIIRALGTADFNEDETVDALDLVDWNTAYSTTDAADANNDGESNGIDLLAGNGSTRLARSSTPQQCRNQHRYCC